jgi:hypothetical protein
MLCLFNLKGEVMKSRTCIMLLCLLGAVLPAYGKERPPLGSRGRGILCTDFFPARPERTAAKQLKQAEAKDWEYPPFPLEDTFTLHSNPGASHRLYIDFDGYVDDYWEPPTIFVYTAWDPNGDGASFSEAELLWIQKIWYLTSEDFMPFNVDVTTEEPGRGFDGMRCIVDGSGMDEGGWAYVGVWPESDSYCYSGLWDTAPLDEQWIWIAQAASHEVGHTLGCSDHGDDTEGYYQGHGTGWTAWGVIMGWDSDSLGVWDDGDYPNPNHSDDSLAIITANAGAGYRADDHGSSTSTATPITLPLALELVAEGIIEQRTDVDYFAFYTSGGSVQFSINEDVVMATSNLDVLAKIHDASGAVLYEENPLWDIWASFDVTLAAGTYYLSIDGTGQDHPDGLPVEGFGYSDYGILGYYSIYASGAASASCTYTCGDLDDSGGDVDMVDFGLFADCWGEDPSLNASCICANLVEDGDNIIDLADLSVFAELFLDSSSNYPPDCSTP